MRKDFCLVVFKFSLVQINQHEHKILLSSALTPETENDTLVTKIDTSPRRN